MKRDRYWRDMAKAMGLDIVENADLVAARKDRALEAVEDMFG